MLDALYNAAEAMHRATTDFETVSHNLANVSTAGFRRIVTQHPETQQSQAADGAAAATMLPDQLALDLIQGPLVKSGSNLDIALDGPGFIELAGPEGSIEDDGQPLFTRDGRLQINSEGQLVTVSGLLIQGDGGPISIPVGAEVAINTEGGVIADGVLVGTISIKEPVDPQDVITAGDGVYTIANAVPATETIVCPGMYEGSNVSAVLELVRMIEAMRRYEAAQKTITSVSEAVQRHTTSK